MVKPVIIILFTLQMLIVSVAAGSSVQTIDTVYFRAAIERADNFISKGSYDLAYKVADSMRIATEREGLMDSYAISLNRLGVVLRCKGDLSHSLIHFNRSLHIADSLHNKNLLSSNYNNIGAVNRMLGNYPLALTYYLKCLKIKEELNDLDGMSAVFNNIGIVYLYQGDYSKALDYYGRSQVISQRIKDLDGLSISYINIGEVYQKMGNYSDAIACYMKALELSEKLGDSDSQAVISNELGNIYKSKGDLAYACGFYQKALVVFEQLGDKYRIAQVLTNLGGCNLDLNKRGDAYHQLSRALALSQPMGSWELIRDVSFMLSKYYQVTGNFKEALQFHQRYTAARDSSFSKEKTEQLIRAQMRFDFEREQEKVKVEQEKRTVITAEKNRWQRTVRLMLSVIVIALLSLLAILYRNFRHKKLLFKKLEENQNEIVEKNEELLQQQEEILAQRDEIEVKNTALLLHQKEIEDQNGRIMSSLDYAKTIQEAILPEEDFFAANFRDYFIIYKPKDIVSGDFYWTHQDSDNVIVALADCTGHGVPGGFMSMIGNTLLNQIVVEWKSKDPAVILQNLNELVRKSLKQDNEAPHSSSGMDIAIFVYDKKQGIITFAGAKRPLYLFINGEFVKIGGDSRSIGGYQLEATRVFTRNTISVEDSTFLYLFSDGYTDQLNNDDRKFSIGRLKTLLAEIYRLPLAKQKLLLLEAHRSHKGSREQIDDITFIGLAL